MQGVETTRGYIAAPKVGCVAAGHSSVLAAMAGLRLPIESHPLQALVSEPIKPVLDTVVMSGAVHVYVSQSDKGELVLGAGIDAYNSYAQRGSPHVLEHQLAALTELFPIFSRLRFMRQWGGIVDVCPDASPIVAKMPVAGPLLQLRLGHRRLQGDARLRLGVRPHHRAGPAAQAQRGLHAGALLPRLPDRRTRRRRGGALMERRHDAADPLPLLRRARGERVLLWRRGAYRAAAADRQAHRRRSGATTCSCATNPKGVHFERWNHARGCRRWFNVARHTVTHEILAVYKMGEPPPASSRRNEAMTSQPYRLPQGGRIDRSKPIAFTFNGRQLTRLSRRHPGLGAAGQRRDAGRPQLQISPAARHHDARAAEEPNALVQLGERRRTEPNIRATVAGAV